MTSARQHGTIHRSSKEFLVAGKGMRRAPMERLPFGANIAIGQASKRSACSVGTTTSKPPRIPSWENPSDVLPCVEDVLS